MELKLNLKVDLPLPNGETITVAAKDFMKLHDDMTDFINNNYEALIKDND